MGVVATLPASHPTWSNIVAATNQVTVVELDPDSAGHEFVFAGVGALEIVVSLKDAVDGERHVVVYTVPVLADRCLPWPTGRDSCRRTGAVAGVVD